MVESQSRQRERFSPPRSFVVTYYVRNVSCDGDRKFSRTRAQHRKTYMFKQNLLSRFNLVRFIIMTRKMWGFDILGEISDYKTLFLNI